MPARVPVRRCEAVPRQPDSTFRRVTAERDRQFEQLGRRGRCAARLRGSRRIVKRFKSLEITGG